MKKNTVCCVEDFEDDDDDDTPDVNVKAELVPFFPTAEIQKAFDESEEKFQKTIKVSPINWPKGRTCNITLKLALVPIALVVEFGQE